MRWPVRYQVLLPMVGLMLGTLIGATALNAYFAGRQVHLQIDSQLRRVLETLREANFPLTDPVLEQMRGLSGAEFVLTDGRHEVVAASLVDPQRVTRQMVPSPAASESARLLRHAVTVGQQRYFYAVVPQPSTSTLLRERRTLHVFYPVASYRQIWRHAVLPPLAVGAVSILLVGLVSVMIARRVTTPLSHLQKQVEQIAQGEFQQLPIGPRDDELSDLSRSVNRMSQMLAGYEREVRQHERLRTLGQLGSGIAHQMRNAATGGRLALELHRRACPFKDDESLTVARRQLVLMEEHLRKFLSLGKYQPARQASVDLRKIISGAVELVRPTAEHLRVELVWQPPADANLVLGDADGLEQLMVNLLTNGVEAASGTQTDTLSARDPATQQASVAETPSHRVLVALLRQADQAEIQVRDNGSGPRADLADHLFEPFITEKMEGTGLGLPVAQEIASAHQGTITWKRSGDWTVFSVTLPGGMCNAAQS